MVELNWFPEWVKYLFVWLMSGDLTLTLRGRLKKIVSAVAFQLFFFFLVQCLGTKGSWSYWFCGKWNAWEENTAFLPPPLALSMQLIFIHALNKKIGMCTCLKCWQLVSVQGISKLQGCRSWLCLKHFIIIVCELFVSQWHNWTKKAVRNPIMNITFKSIYCIFL